MNVLSKISNSQLLENTKSLVLQERKVMREVLEHLEEIERRRLYAIEGYSSLFQYAELSLGYTPNEAYTRISSMRLMRQIPEIKKKIEEGSLNITTLSLAQNLFRKEELDLDQKKEILKAFSGKSKRECEKIVAQISPEAVCQEREKILSEEMTELRIPVSSALLEKLKKLQELTGKDSYQALLELMANEMLKKKDLNQTNLSQKDLGHNKETKEKALEKPLSQEIDQEKLNSQENPLKNPLSQENSPEILASEKKALEKPVSLWPAKVTPRYIPAALKREIFRKDQGQCSFVHPTTQRRCTEKRHLEYDHIKPHSLGGPSTRENLRLLCRAHNQLAALQIFGAAKLRPRK